MIYSFQSLSSDFLYLYTFLFIKKYQGMSQRQIQNSHSTSKIFEESTANLSTYQDIITLTMKAVEGKSLRQRFKKAKKFLYNALQFKSPRVDIQQAGRPQSVRWAHKLETNPRFRKFLLILSFIFMYLAFAENNFSPVLIGFEILIITIFVVSLALEIHHKSFNKQLSETKFKLKLYIKAISLALLLIDSIIALARQDLHVRLFLIFRCVLPVAIDAQVRKLFYALVKTYKVIIVYMIFYFLVIIAFGIMANQFIEYPNPKYYYQNYKDLGNSIFLMYVLTTFDNYPDGQQNILQTSLWIYLFFIVYILLIALIFAAIPINIVLDSIKQTRSKAIIIDQLEQQHNIIMSFIALGGDKTKSIPYRIFIQFLLYLFNFEDKYLDKILAICKNLDTNFDGNIQCIQYMQICKIIQSREYLSPPKHRYWKKLTPFERYLQTKYKLKEIVKSKRYSLYEGIYSVFIFVNCILDIYTYYLVFNIIDDINFIVMIFLTGFKLIAAGPELFFNNHLDIFDLIIVLLAMFFEVAPSSLTPRNADVIVKMFRIYKINQIIDFILEKFRLKSSIYQKFSQMVTHIGLIFPIVLKFFPLYLLSFYSLGVLGTQIFSYHIKQQTDYSSNRQFSNFDTMVGSQFLLVQILVEASWSFLVYDHIVRYGYYTLVVIFFIVCHQIIVILHSSLFKGIVWECYNTISDAQNDHNQKRREKQKALEGLVRRYKQFNCLKKKIKLSKIIQPTDPFIRELYQRKVDAYILERLKLQFRINLLEKNKIFKFSQIILPNRFQSLNEVNQRSIEIQKKYISQNRIFRKETILNPFHKQDSINQRQYMKEQKKSNKTSGSLGELIIQQAEIQIQSDHSEEIDEIQKNAEDIYDDQYEGKVDKLLDSVALEKYYILEFFVQSPQCFVDFLKHQLKKLRKDLPKSQQFDVNVDSFENSPSKDNTLITDIDTLLKFTTSDKQKKFAIINEMVDLGIINQQKAEIMLFESSQYENQLTFDYNWVIRKTYLSDFSENDIKDFQIKYFTEVFGQKFKKISKVTLDSIMNMEAKIIYSLGNLLRYPQIQSQTFFRRLLSIQNKINVELLKQGSLCKFVYQIKSDKDVWLTLDLKDSNNIGIQFMKNGVWLSSSGNLQKNEIYVCKNIFHWEGYERRPDKQQCEKYIKKLFQTFESLAFSSDDKDCFFNPFPQNRCYDLFTFYRNVQRCPRVNQSHPQISKIMFFILSNESTKQKNIPFKISDFEYTEQQQAEYKDKIKIKFKLDQNSEQMSEILGQLQNQNEYRRYRDGLPYAYMINFLTQIKQMMMINQKNFFHHIENVLRSNLQKETIVFRNNMEKTNKNRNRFTELKQKREKS